MIMWGCSAQDPDVSTGPAPITAAEAETIYDYVYPLVIMKISQDVMLSVPFREKGQLNCFIHFKRLAGPQHRAVVLGNRNTHYSVGWVDLTDGPVLFDIPDMGERYYVMPLLDAWTNTFESLGSRTTGQAPQKYAIVSEGWQGELPEGYTQIMSPTNMVWITGRTQADSAQDSEAVGLLQDKLVIKPMNEGASNTRYKPEFKAIKVRKPVPYSLKMSAEDYYDTFLAQWAENPSPERDAPMLALMAQVGLVPGVTGFDDLSPAAQAVLTQGLKAKQKAYLEAFYEGSEQTEPWIFNLDPRMGAWETEYGRRAYWGMWGLGTNIAKDAVYGVTQLGQDMQPLHGDHVYKIHFAAGDTPPTRAFWSVTLYDNEGYLEANNYDRYDLGSNHDLSYNPDGSLDIYLSRHNTAGYANWVPAPKKAYKILLRIYWPDEAVLAGEWALPPIEKVAANNP